MIANIMAAVTAIVAIALLGLLAGMEGLEVAVIARWRGLWPSSDSAALARWLSARQLFVALIVTTATLLARRSALVIPGTTIRINEGLSVDVFDLTWIGLTVLWVAQIAPKTLAAINPDRYLSLFKPALFPLVEAVRISGVSQPGEWIAGWISHLSGWYRAMTSEQMGLTEKGDNVALVWRSLTSDAPPLTVPTEPTVPRTVPTEAGPPPEFPNLKIP